MPVVIDQFEIFRDQQAGPEPAAASRGGAPAPAAAPTPPPLGPHDIADVLTHLDRRAARLRPT